MQISTFYANYTEGTSLKQLNLADNFLQYGRFGAKKGKCYIFIFLLTHRYIQNYLKQIKVREGVKKTYFLRT